MRIKDTNERSANTLLRQDHAFNNVHQHHVISHVPIQKLWKMFGAVLEQFIEANDSAQLGLANDKTLSVVSRVSSDSSMDHCDGAGDIFTSVLDTLSDILNILPSACWCDVAWLRNIINYLCEANFAFLIAFAEPISRFINSVFTCIPSTFYDRRLLKKFNSNLALKLLDATVISAYLNEKGDGATATKRSRGVVSGISSSSSTAAKRAKKRKLNQRKQNTGSSNDT